MGRHGRIENNIGDEFGYRDIVIWQLSFQTKGHNYHRISLYITKRNFPGDKFHNAYRIYHSVNHDPVLQRLNSTNYRTLKKAFKVAMQEFKAWMNDTN